MESTKSVGAIVTDIGPLASAKGLKSEVASGAGADSDFSALIGRTMLEGVGQLRRAEAVSVAAIHGTASVQDAVEQVMAAERTLQASIAIRDKIVGAYLEISRMAI